jgi:uncharacterized protein YdeI (YjbR/CyaY-like superfamily)
VALKNQKSIKNLESRIKNEWPRFKPASRDAWRSWLRRRHETSSGVWVVYAKKHTGLPSLTHDEAVEEALCFGWIDSLRRPLDDRFFQQLFTPRKPKSSWSGLNKKRVATLSERGLMTAAGIAAVELAKRTGTWDALAHVDSLFEPDNLRGALDRNAKARTNWNALSPGERKRYLYWLSHAKREETRAARIKQIVTLVASKASLIQSLAEAKGKRKSAPS